MIIVLVAAQHVLLEIPPRPFDPTKALIFVFIAALVALCAPVILAIFGRR